MTRVSLALFAVFLLLASCNEHNPLLTLSIPNLVDSSYVGPVVAPQSHNVLIEELTGASCSNCPKGRIVLDGIIAGNPFGAVNIIAIHPKGFSQGNPLPGSTYDFRTDVGTDIYQRVYLATNFMPSAGIDRTTVGGNLALDRSIWPGTVNSGIASKDSINLSITSRYSPLDSTVRVLVTTTYPYAMPGTLSLCVAIVEDTLLDLQDDGSTILHNYVFNNVFREFVNEATTDNGDVVVNTIPTPAGTVDIKAYTHKVKMVWDASHCRIVAFVTNGTVAGSGGSILQSAQCKLVGP